MRSASSAPASTSRTPSSPPSGAHDPNERPERDPVSVGKAGPHEHTRVVFHRAAELCGEPRLPDACGAHDRHEPTGSIGHRSVERLPEHAELALAADQWGVEPPRIGGRALDDRECVPRNDRFRLSLQGERIAWLEHDGVLDEAPRGLTDEDLSGSRRFLEPLRGRDRISGDEPLPTGAVPGHDLAGIDADADPDPDSELLLELFVQPGEGKAKIGRGADGAQRVVFVQLRDPEDGHHRITDELLEGAAVALEDRSHRIEVPRHDLSERLGIESLAESRPVGDVGEEDGNRAAADGHVLSLGLGLQWA